MPLGPGSRLDGYELIQPLGAGGMGEVWLAKDVRLERKVALKLLPPELTRDPTRVSRFEQEARAASALNHPNVCHIYALGQTDEGQQYIAMEYVEGETLRQRLSTSRLTIRESLDTAVQIAAALTAAHAAGIVHRDIKPENVMSRPDGLVKVLDFGLAKLALVSAGAGGAGDAATVLKTEVGMVVGTAAYMSPEQARGDAVDPRTDIWSLGVLLYEAVAGRAPFAAPSSTEVLAAILDRDPPPLARYEPDAPGELQRILTKALRKDRTQRFQTMQDLLLDMEALRDDLRTSARSGSGTVTRAATATAQPAPGGSAHLPAVRPRRRLVVGAAALGLGAIVATPWWWTARNPVQPQSASDNGSVQRNLTRLTFGEGLQTDVTFSPDGHFIAYASDRAGNFDIWVQPVAGGDAVQITKGPEADTQPAWSPDGSTIAFRSERDGGGVFLVSALGGHERRLAVAGEWPRWSPDGSQVLVQTEAPQSIELWIVRPGESPRPVLAEFMKDGRFWWAHWHPDGRVSLAGQHRDRGAGFYTVPLEGGEPASSSLAPPVEHLVRNLRQSRFAWSRDGRHVIVEASPRPGVQNLWRVAIEPGSLTWTSAERLTNGPNVDTQAAVSADGTVLAYTIATQSYRLHGYDMPARGMLPGRGTALTPVEEWALTPDISRDGTRLVYLAVQPGARVHPQLWVVDLVTGERHAGPTDGALRTNPAWSADGALLAYAYDRPDGVGEDRKRGALVVSDRAGRERFLSTRRDGALYPWGWTPDGRYVTASMQRLTAPVTVGLWAADRTDQPEPERVLLSQPRTDFWQARVSPDGRWVAFVVASRDDGASRVAVAPIDDTDPARWSQLPAKIIADKPRWAHDGRNLYFLGRSGRSSMHLWRVPFDPSSGRWVGDPVQLTDFSSPEFEINPDVERTELSVTEDRVFLTMRRTSGSIWMLDNVDR